LACWIEVVLVLVLENGRGGGNWAVLAVRKAQKKVKSNSLMLNPTRKTLGKK
jgi:hypothetical protein